MRSASFIVNIYPSIDIKSANHLQE